MECILLLVGMGEALLACFTQSTPDICYGVVQFFLCCSAIYPVPPLCATFFYYCLEQIPVSNLSGIFS
jgi:hypothetical protein